MTRFYLCILILLLAACSELRAGAGPDSDGGVGGDGQVAVDATVPLDGAAAVPCDPTEPGELLAGAWHACLLRCGKLVCWGDNSAGQIAPEDARGGLEPTLVSTGLLDAPIGLAALGAAHTCVQVDDGYVQEVLCQGSGSAGQLGSGSTSATGGWVLAESTSHRVLALAAGDRHSCVVSDKTVCFGDDALGQKGNGEEQNVGFVVTTLRPPLERLLGQAGISAGKNHTCAWSLGGEARCWGAGDKGQLGSGRPDPMGTAYIEHGAFNPVAGEHSWSSLSAGDEHTCGMSSRGGTQDAAIHCWGSAADGRLGDGDATAGGASTPVPVAWPDDAGQPALLAVGGAHSCAVNERGQVYCWGSNRWLQTGQYEPNPRTELTLASVSTPTRVAFETDIRVVAIAAGADFTCALGSDAEVLCWGNPINFALGEDTQCDGGGCPPAEVAIPAF